MHTEFFRYQQIIARKKLNIDGKLTYSARTELCYFRKYNKDISEEFQDIFNILFAIKISEFVSNKWIKNSCPPYGSMIIYLFEYVKLSIGNPDFFTPEQIHSIIMDMDMFTTEVSHREFNEEYHPIFFTCYNLSKKEKVKALFSLSAIEAAIICIVSGGLHFDTSIPDDWIPDADFIDTADSASQATDLSPKEFWTWYIDVAFPQALAEVPKYLKQDEC